LRKNEKIYWLIIASIIGTGISSIANQIIIIREFLNQFNGNEISISIVIFYWLILGGLGSLLSKFFQKNSIFIYSVLLFFIAILPIIQLVFIRILKQTIFIRGASANFYSMSLFVFFTISIYCILIGFILPYSQKVIYSTGYKLKTGFLYLIDNIGDIIGGAILSLILIYILTPFPIIAITSSLLIFVSLVLLYYQRKKFLFIICIFFTAIFYVLCLNSKFEKSTLAIKYGKIIKYLESPYGRILITKEDNQTTFWESGNPIYFTNEIAKTEEKIHYALCQLDSVKNVLLISGGFGRTITEVEKYHPLHIDYVELDPYVTKIALKLGIIAIKPNISIINTDGRYYIKHTKKRYSAIIIDLPEPDTFQINRFFTKEFFFEAKSRLFKNGVLCISMKYSPNYISKIRKEKISVLYNTLRACFKHIILIPGESLYFIASEHSLYMDIPKRLHQLAIKTIYITPFFYGNITLDRLKNIIAATKADNKINRDLKPCLVNIMLKEWFEKFNTSFKSFLVIFISLSILYVIFIKKEEYILFSSGFCLMGMEMLIIFLFQIIYGYIYLKLGIIITIFLAGLLPGSILGMKAEKALNKKLIISEILIIIMILICLFWVFYFQRKNFNTFYSLFFLYPFIFSGICGFQFPLIAKVIGEEKSPAANCFAADLIGASIGTISIGILFIPVYGIVYTILVIILLKLISFFIAFKI